MGGFNPQTLPGFNNTGTLGQTAPNYNPQQAPSRLQLASRQTMPKEYPKFNGDPTKWAIFYSTFVNCTKECGLSNAENLGRLVACLEEPAVTAVKNLLTRPEAVPEIIGTLQMLYGRPEASIETQLDTIRKSPPPKMHLMQTFIDFAMAVRNVSSEIHGSNMWQYLYDPRTLKELTDKLPYHMRLEWGEVMVSTPNVNLSHFSDWLFLRAKMACAVTLPAQIDKKNSKTSSDNHVNAHQKDYGSVKKAETNNSKRFTNSNGKTCDVCHKNSHDAVECRKFLAMTLNDRWECVKTNKLCKVCLGNHHMLRCESKLLCGESGCTIKHHRLLHNPSTLKVVATKDERATSNAHNAHQVNEIVILRRYIPVILHGPKQSIMVIAFLDDGSDMTLVEHWPTQKLGITGKPEDLYLKWTAQIVRKEPNSQSVDFDISGTHAASKKYRVNDVRTVKSLNEIKQKFVIPRLRVVLKRIRRNCQHCKNITAQPNPPEMAPLPMERLATFTRPYTFVGIDYAGPYKIVQFRRTVKRWIVLFTCLTIRAVYIDVVESLESDSCIMSIRRFTARNGNPSKFFSDRATTLIGANNELAREIEKIDQDLLNVTFTTSYTEWHFNPPYGQHMGGTWERLIGSMKKTLDKILPSSHYPNHETFITALAEVENIINSRPLTFVSIEPDDREALTPNHFLKGSSNGNKPPGIFPPLPKTLRGNWRYSQQIADEFWRKWVKEYLPMITRRTKWFDNVKPIEVGDQVIIVDEDTPRNTWERGVVIEALQSDSDGIIRRANVRTINGIYTRPVTKLAVLDIKGPEAKLLTRETLAGGSVTASTETGHKTSSN